MKDKWYNIMLLIAMVSILLGLLSKEMGLLSKERGDTFGVILYIGYLLLFFVVARDSYINYMQEKGKKYLIQLCFNVFSLVFFLFYILLKMF